MMKASELRLGNITNYGIVSVISEEHIEFVGVDKAIHIHNVEPVPLTEEKLLELGFEKGIVNVFINAWAKLSFYLTIRGDGKLLYEWNGGNIEVKYVHHLQNLHKLLTGEELTPITK